MTEQQKTPKFIFVTGGVLSGIGKGIAAASIGAILKARGLKVNIQKCDPYLNVDSGTLNPAEHGECFVTLDGAETDLDLGHYERYLDQELTQKSSLMSGRVIREVLEDERAGKYLGRTVQFVPHVTDLMKKKIKEASQDFDVHMVEVGGTVGDIEATTFLEAIREIGIENGRENTLFAHAVYIPYLDTSKEFKTKPAQNALKDLRSVGIFPELVLARSERPAPLSAKKKLALFSGAQENAIAMLPNAESIYQVPLSLELQGIGNFISERLSLGESKVDLSKWEDLTTKIAKSKKNTVTIGMVIKYADNEDSYYSVNESLRIAGWHSGATVKIKPINAEKIETDDNYLKEALADVDGVLIPGGFGSRGIEGKIKAADYAFKNKIPYLGICLGLQVAAIAAVRRVGLGSANSIEFDPKTPDPVVHTMQDQKGKEGTGGTMRLGNYDCKLAEGSLAKNIYKQELIKERHRHRYEINSEYLELLEEAGLKLSGTNPESNLPEILEADPKLNHPFYIGVQYHPEFKSRPNNPHPLFLGLIQAAL
jgi:CTP synthase